MSQNEAQQIPYVRPAEMRYEDLLPVGMKARKQKQIFRPANVGDYDPASNGKILLNLHGDMFLNARNSYLKFAVKTVNHTDTSADSQVNKAAGVALENSAHSFFANIVIRSGSREIERLSNYNLLHCALSDYTLNKDYRSTSGSVMEGYGDGTVYKGGALGQAGTGEVSQGTVTSINQVKRNEVYMETGSEKVFCINILSGLLQSNRFIPMLALRGSSGLQIELELADANQCFVQNSGGTVSPALSYKMTGIEYHAECIHFSNDFNQMFLNKLMSDGGLQIHGVSYNSSVAHFDPENVGQQHIGISHRFRSLKYLMAIQRNAAYVSDSSKRSLSCRLTNNLKAYHYEIGGQKYPEYPVQCDVAKGLVGEAFAEIEKMFGKLGDRLNSSCVDRFNFAPQVGTAKHHNPEVNSRFMTGIELETYGSNNIEAGIDTANSSPSMNLVLDCAGGTDNTSKNSRLDSIACFDCLYQVNPDLTLSVAF